jgi:outer membrane protein assembly factor BamB
MKPKTILSLLVLLALSPRALAAEAEWPFFHGPNRDNISTDTGLLKSWPKGGPKLLWKFAPCGRGHSSVSVAGGRIFTVGDFAGQEKLITLDMTGTRLWQADNGDKWRGQIPGARTTPTYSDGAVYQLNPNGRLASFDAKTGKELWAKDLKQIYDVKISRWALAENVAIEGDTLLVAPGGTKGRIVALDKKTGEQIWAHTELKQNAAYCSPLLVTHEGVRQLITLMQKSVVGIDVKTGTLLWQHPHVTRFDQNVTMPIYHDGHVYVSTGHGAGGRVLKIQPGGKSVKQVWEGKDLDNCHGGVILIGGHLYGSGCRLFKRGLVCAEFLTGKAKWNHRGVGKVSVTFADGLLYCVTDKGKMSLVQATPAAAKIVSQFQIPRKNKRSCYAHPVVTGGRLYVRQDEELFVYDVRGK